MAFSDPPPLHPPDDRVIPICGSMASSDPPPPLHSPRTLKTTVMCMISSLTTVALIARKHWPPRSLVIIANTDCEYSRNCKKGIALTSQMEGAIRTTSFHIAIFSPRYAESSWCLKKIMLMVEFKTTIILVSYGVQPSELRWTQGETGLYDRVLSVLPWDLCMLCCTRGENGVYAGYLLELEEKKTRDGQTGQKKPRYDSNTIKEWRAALFNVGGRSVFGMEVLIMVAGSSFSKGRGRFSLVPLLLVAEAPRFPWLFDKPPNS